MNPSVGQTFVQNFAISLSSTTNFQLSDSINSNALGVGVRFMIWQGSKGERERIIEKYTELLKDLSITNRLFTYAGQFNCNGCKKEKVIKDYIEKITEKSDELFNPKLNQINISRIIDEYEKFLQEKLYESTDYSHFSDSIEVLNDVFFDVDETVMEISKLRSDRKGFKLEVAGATGLNFPTNQIDFSVAPKVGFWLTPSFQPYKTDWIEFIGVIRYYNHNLDFYKEFLPNNNIYNYNWDLGLRLAFKKNKYSIELEGVYRTAQTLISEEIGEDGIKTRKTKSEDDFQYLINFNYHINDKVLLTYNYGKSFEPVLNYEGNLISLLTLNFAINTPTSEVLD